MNGHALANGLAHLVSHVPEPRRARLILDSGFRDEQRTPVAFVDLLQHLPHRPVPRVRGFDHRAVTAGIDPLVVHVVVDPDDAEIVLASAELGECAAGHHVQRGVLRLPMRLRRSGILRSIGMRDDVDHGLGMDDADVRIRLAHRVDSRDGRPEKLHLEVVAPAGRKWIEDADVPAGPREERDLVHRNDPGR